MTEVRWLTARGSAYMYIVRMSFLEGSFAPSMRMIFIFSRVCWDAASCCLPRNLSLVLYFVDRVLGRSSHQLKFQLLAILNLLVATGSSTVKDTHKKNAPRPEAELHPSASFRVLPLA